MRHSRQASHFITASLRLYVASCRTEPATGWWYLNLRTVKRSASALNLSQAVSLCVVRRTSGLRAKVATGRASAALQADHALRGVLAACDDEVDRLEVSSHRYRYQRNRARHAPQPAAVERHAPYMCAVRLVSWRCDANVGTLLLLLPGKNSATRCACGGAVRTR